MNDPVEIIAAVGLHSGFTVEQLTGKSRKRPLVLARHLAIWVIRHRTELSFPEIGRLFNEAHTSTINSEQLVDRLFRERREGKPPDPVTSYLWDLYDRFTFPMPDGFASIEEAIGLIDDWLCSGFDRSVELPRDLAAWDLIKNRARAGQNMELIKAKLRERVVVDNQGWANIPYRVNHG